MIIQLQGAAGAVGVDVMMARQRLEEMAGAWGHEVTGVPSGGEGEPDWSEAGHSTRGGIDPVALATLIMSIPSAALAVTDLADRIGKRRRAGELIEQARQAAARQVHVVVVLPGRTGRTVDVAGLTPDELLELAVAAEEASAREPAGESAREEG